jgi:hypothetical protein
VIEIIKGLCRESGGGARWNCGDETDGWHKIEKLQIIKLVPGRWLRRAERRHGITLEESIPLASSVRSRR